LSPPTRQHLAFEDQFHGMPQSCYGFFLGRCPRQSSPFAFSSGVDFRYNGFPHNSLSVPLASTSFFSSYSIMLAFQDFPISRLLTSSTLTVPPIFLRGTPYLSGLPPFVDSLPDSKTHPRPCLTIRQAIHLFTARGSLTTNSRPAIYVKSRAAFYP